MKLQLSRFDPSAMKPHRIILLVGRRGSGKSKALDDLMFHVSSKVDFGVAMTPTEDTARSFRKCMPDGWIHSAYSAEKVDTLLKSQRELAKNDKQRNLFVVMDDCMYDKKILKSTVIRDLFMNGRHQHVTLFNAMQYVMDMPPDLRTQVDYCFVFKENIMANKVKLWKYFFGMFEKYDDFNRVLERCTDNYGILVLDNTTPTSELNQCVFWYRANLNLPPYKMGKQVYWKLANNLERSSEQKNACLRSGSYDNQQKNKRITSVVKTDESGKIVDEELTLMVN